MLQAVVLTLLCLAVACNKPGIVGPLEPGDEHEVEQVEVEEEEPEEEELEEVEEVELVEYALFGRLTPDTVWYVSKGKYIGYIACGVYVQEFYNGPWQILRRDEYSESVSWIHIIYNSEYENYRYKIVMKVL